MYSFFFIYKAFTFSINSLIVKQINTLVNWDSSLYLLPSKMVNLMLQPVFLNVVKGSTDTKMTSDDLYNMWSVASRAKSAIVQGRRLENLSWRLWYTSTIRAKLEMEEKRRNSEFNENDNGIEVDFDNSDVELSTSSSSHSKKRRVQSREAIVLPSDRPLFTSTCTSILAEIQDASYRFGQSSVLGINHFTTSPNLPANNQNIISPPITRVKSPANTIYHGHARKKKNVEKFLKKFKSNLEEITEQFDEKLGFTDEETTNNEDFINKREEQEKESFKNNFIPDNSPTNSSNHFATDEEGGQESTSFYARINLEKSPKKKPKPATVGLISKLLLRKEQQEDSDFSVETKGSFKVKPEPINKKSPQFLNFSNSNSLINNQLELMAGNQYNRLSGSNSGGIKSPRPMMSKDNESTEAHSSEYSGDISGNSSGNSNNTNNYILQTHSPTKRIIDANTLSSSLSASKFRLEDEFDSQIIIW